MAIFKIFIVYFMRKCRHRSPCSLLITRVGSENDGEALQKEPIKFLTNATQVTKENRKRICLLIMLPHEDTC
ncbi:hypothetical protein MTR_5g041585 [Medicago truncatula]|uniref:Uncharacterized protein n=1 Tax=Medicago truncatula TaxID=3880 RepID=A0A072UDZ7_MEDTR|nr:hypothetical protein MTR_5g041585 [Medicago truncatula]